MPGFLFQREQPLAQVCLKQQRGCEMKRRLLAAAIFLGILLLLLWFSQPSVDAATISATQVSVPAAQARRPPASARRSPPDGVASCATRCAERQVLGSKETCLSLRRLPRLRECRR